MKFRWNIFFAITVLCLLGTISLTYTTYTDTPPNNSAFVEAVKTAFLCLGGLGVILPLYINATNAMESRSSLILENTFDLLVKWDDSHLLQARNFTRDIKKNRENLSDNQLIKEILENDDLEQSIILLTNYFEHVRFSIKTKRIATSIFKDSLGDTVLDIIARFRPYYKTKPAQVLHDLDELTRLLRQ